MIKNFQIILKIGLQHCPAFFKQNSSYWNEPRIKTTISSKNVNIQLFSSSDEHKFHKDKLYHQD